MRARRCDFHMHTSLSDGELLPMELIRRTAAADHRAIAITDHASFSNMEWIIETVTRDCEKADAWGLEAIPGIELTHVPVRYIDQAVRKAKKAGAEIIIVHGETPVEPVERGTNFEAVSNPDVDILAHPGMMTLEEGELAAKNKVFLEVTCRKGHSLANGHVSNVARNTGALLLVNTDAHAPEDLSSMEFATKVARGSGMLPEEVRSALVESPEKLLKRVGRK